MGYYVKSAITTIESKYENFTTVEKNIADFFIHNKESQDLSGKTIAQRLFVSEASLSRFAKKCGYSGYREFIYQYKEGFVEKVDTITSNVMTILNTYQELLNKTYSLLDEDQIMRISDYLNKARQVYVCGKGSSGLAANEMELRFMRIGVNIDSIRDLDQMKMRGVFQNGDNIVFGISISGETEEVLHFLRESHKHDAKTVLITSQMRDSLVKYCDEVVLVPSLKHLNHGKLISPQFPVLVMLDILYSHFVRYDKTQKEKMHEDTLRALEIGISQAKIEK